MQEQPIYDAVVRDHDFDPSTLIRFDLAAFLASHRGPTGVPEGSRPRKGARRVRRA